MKTADQLCRDALLQTSMIPQENNNIPEYMVGQAFLLLNDIISMWGSDTTLAPYTSELNFNFVANKERYTVGIGDSYDIQHEPMIDITSFTYMIDPNNGNNLWFNVDQITEPQYAAILYRSVSIYPSQYLLRYYPKYTEIIVQPLPQQAYPVQLMVKSRLPKVDLYQDPETLFPPGYLLCLKYQLMLDICDSFGFDPGTAFVNKARKAIADMRGNNKIDLISRKSETLSNRIRDQYPFTPWFT